MESSIFNTSFHRYEVDSIYTSHYDMGESGNVIKKRNKKAKKYQKIQFILKFSE